MEAGVTDANLMDADCVHGETWYECKRCEQGVGVRPEYVYVASSWRNSAQPAVCAVLKAAGIQHYDFRNPMPGVGGFHWSEVMEHYDRGGEGVGQLAPAEEYVAALEHPLAVDGFHRDWDAMQRADCCVLVLPCNRSAHLELGWFVGQGRRTAVLLDGDFVVPELMYKMVDHVSPDLFELLGWLGVED
jgi:hypothetical protein